MRHSEITDVVERTARLVDEHYVFADQGGRLAEMLTRRLADGRYADVDSPLALATLVTDDLQSLNGDLHLRLKYHAAEVPDQPGEAMLVEMLARQADDTMGGVATVALLDGNVAHLELCPLLFPPTIAGEAVAAAMRLVAPAAALVIDVRRNTGGDPDTVALVSSYLYDEPVHLLTIHSRAPAQERQMWTLPFVPGPRFGGTKPVYVLTSGATFSGGEDLSYGLQQNGRATVVGERTKGGAHPRVGFRVHPHLEVTVPTGRPVHPVSATNWEGTGVVPDVDVPAADALTVAHGLAMDLTNGAAA